MLSTGFFVVHDAEGRGDDDVPELTRGKDVRGHLFVVFQLHVKAGRDHAALVQTTVQLNNDLAGALVVNEFEVVYVSCGALLERMELPCFCMTRRNFTTTLETGRTRTCRFPHFSAFTMLFRQSAIAPIFTIVSWVLSTLVRYLAPYF